MSQIEMIKDVPNAQVPGIKKMYEDQGATVVVVPQGDGKSTLVATFAKSAAALAAEAVGGTVV